MLIYSPLQELHTACTSNVCLALIAAAVGIDITNVRPPLADVKDTADLVEAIIWLVSQEPNGSTRSRSFIYAVMIPLFECGLSALRASRKPS